MYPDITCAHSHTPTTWQMFKEKFIYKAMIYSENLELRIYLVGLQS